MFIIIQVVGGQQDLNPDFSGPETPAMTTSLILPPKATWRSCKGEMAKDKLWKGATEPIN